MKKAEFRKAVADKLGVPQNSTEGLDAETVINAVFETVEDGLLTEGSVSIGNLGKFEVVERAARKGRNPQSGEPIDIPARNAIRYRTSKYGRELVN